MVILRYKRNCTNNDVQLIGYKRICTDINEVVGKITSSEKMKQLVSNPQKNFFRPDDTELLDRGQNQGNQEKYANEVIQNRGREQIHQDMKDIMLRRD